MQAMIDEDGDRIEALKPNNTFNPILQTFYQNLQNRALDPQSELQELEPWIKKSLEPNEEVFNAANARKHMSDFENLFPTKLIPKKLVKKERKHWNEIGDELDNLFDANNGGGGNGVAVKNENGKEEEEEDEDGDIDLDDVIATETVVKIGP